MQLIDVFELARTEGHIEGTIPLSDMPGFHTYLADGNAEIRYELTGVPEVMKLPGAVARIVVKASVPCTHCLEAVPFEDEIDVTFAFVKSEEEADKLPVDEDEEGVEVVVGSKKTNVAALIEEELILSLPVLTHEDCEDEALAAQEDDEPREEKANPFAVLADLKTRKS